MITVLFLSSDPKNATHLAIDQEIREIDQKMLTTKFRDEFDIRSHWAVRTSDLQQLFLRYGPNIVQFSGHGTPTNEIVLQDERGLNCPVPNGALTQLFSHFNNTIKCVILNACYSQKQAKAIAAHVDCVIGMANTISDEDARIFSCSFFQAIGFGMDIKKSFDLACNQ